MSHDPQIEQHKTWLGYLQPQGLVVSPPALVRAQAILNLNVVELQQSLLGLVRREGDDQDPFITDFPLFTRRVLGWGRDDLICGDQLPVELEVALPDYDDLLRPTHAVPDPEKPGAFLMLVSAVTNGADLDSKPQGDDAPSWEASPQARLERLLRERDIAVGLLFNGTHLRLVYAPRGESSGQLTFPVGAMCEVTGRPVLAAMTLLLDEFRVFGAPDGRRLTDLLVESRKYQNEVSTKLADQVLGALWELLRGFQAADEATQGWLLTDVSRDDPQHIYGGLLTTLLRLVFLLYAEDQGLLPDHPVYVRSYSVAGLFERLRDDAGRHPDTMDQRFGAWAALLSLFRLVYDGGGGAGFRLPARQGQLFDPEEYPFLEGRQPNTSRQPGERIEPPRISDGCIFRVLQALLILDGERLSYRALDVEQIGSVYEAMMGFAVARASASSLAARPHHVVFDVAALLETAPKDRKKQLKDQTGCELTGKSLSALKAAATPDDVVAALGRKLSPRTPRLLPPGALYLQPGEERRRSGSHYTPRELTEPIVRTTLEPVLAALGDRPRPEQVLELKVCDPAMGSGAFLVESCRQLAEVLVRAWELHAATPDLPPDEDPLLHARRLVAQRCLYGVDRNPFAVNLAKLSLWLVTLARDHAFTFLNHALKCGDSLVGLTRAQIGAFTWEPTAASQVDWVDELMRRVRGSRDAIHALGENDWSTKRALHKEAEDALYDARLAGDLAVSAFFEGSSKKDREERRRELGERLAAWRLERSSPPPGLRPTSPSLGGGVSNGLSIALPQTPPPVEGEVAAPAHWMQIH